jgi:hypothetical protein
MTFTARGNCRSGSARRSSWWSHPRLVAPPTRRWRKGHKLRRQQLIEAAQVRAGTALRLRLRAGGGVGGRARPVSSRVESHLTAHGNFLAGAKMDLLCTVSP